MTPINDQTILFVDDDPLSREGFNMAFGKTYNCILCDSARQAESAMDDGICVAIIDIRMAGKDGFECCNAIRKKYPDLPIIFYSGYPEEKHPIDVINQHQPFAFITKGGDLDALASAIEKACEFHGRTSNPISPAFLETNIGEAAALLLPNELSDEYSVDFMQKFLLRCKKAALLNTHIIKTRGDIYIPNTRKYHTMIDTAKKALNAKISLVLTGEKGTGKTVFPHYLGTLFPEKPFVYIDCHASSFSSDGLLDNEHLELARDGILCLDNMNRLSMIDQNMLLNWIDEHDLKSHTAIIATGPLNMDQQLRSYGLNDRLFSELSGVQLVLPSISDMTDQIEDMIHHFSTKYQSIEGSIELTDAELAYFMQRDWLGNIFELDASLRQYFQDDKKIDIELVPQAIRKELISTVLTKCNFNVSQASIYLGMKRPRLYQLIEALNIPMEKRSYQTKKK